MIADSYFEVSTEIISICMRKWNMYKYWWKKFLFQDKVNRVNSRFWLLEGEI